MYPESGIMLREVTARHSSYSGKHRHVTPSDT